MRDNNIMDWDDEIEEEGNEVIILPEGDYQFTVVDMIKGTFPGSAKLPQCNKATLKLEVRHENKLAYIQTDLILYRTLEWKLSQFFKSIGQKQNGERVKMDWNAVVGSKGWAHIKVRDYTTKSGDTRTVNDVDKFIMPPRDIKETPIVTATMGMGKKPSKAPAPAPVQSAASDPDIISDTTLPF